MRAKDDQDPSMATQPAGGRDLHARADGPAGGKFQVQQRETTGIIVRLVPGEGFHPGVAGEVERRLRCFVGEPFEIRFVTVPSIELGPTGKHRCVVSEVSARSDP